MTDKIIGFTITKNEIDHSDVDVFNVGLNCLTFQKDGYYCYLWGIGDLSKCIIQNKYTLSFPHSDTLLDRNILVYFEDNKIIIENDWLGSIPVFYNEQDLIISTLSLKTLTDKKIHPEGLTNFVEFGYSILEQTPFSGVKFMRYFSKLEVERDEIRIQYKKDPVLNENLFVNETNEDEVFSKIKKYINDVESSTENEIVLPTSGGFDSRLLNLCVKDKQRIRSFTYGISDDQSKSSEVVHAKKISEILGTQWEQIELIEFNQYINDWFKIYGISTHLHGMYHIEFYKKMLSKHKFSKNVTFLSGIHGGGWSGQIKIKNISNYRKIEKLSNSHGLNADKNQLLLASSDNLKRQFFIEHQDDLKNEKNRIIFTIRFKIILISYLTIIPEYFGMPVWTPFLNFDNAIAMLNLPEDRRDNRKWQRDLFSKNHLDLENMDLLKDSSNTLNYQAYMNGSFEPLDIQIMSKYFNSKYLKEINKIMLIKPTKLQERLSNVNKKIMNVRYIGFILKQLRVKQNNKILIVYPHHIIKTIEMSLKKKIEVQKIG